MKFITALILGWASLLGLNAYAHNSLCTDSLLGTSAAKVYQRVELLNPRLNFSDQNVIVALRQEIWKYLPNGGIPWKDRPELGSELEAHLRTTFSKQFRTEDMGTQDLYLFYANQLRSIYSLAVRYWMQQELDTLGVKGAEHIDIGMALLTRMLDTASLMSPTLSPQSVKELLEKKSWRNFSWDKMDQVDQMPHADKELMELVTKFPGASQPCCHSQQGCMMCPNNMSWLRPKVKR